MKNPYSKKLVFVLGFFVLCVCVLYYFLFADIKHRNENASLFLHSVSSEIVKQQYILSLEHMIQSADSDISRVNNSFIAKDADVTFIEGLEKMAKDNRLTLSIDSLVLESDPILAGSGVSILRVKAKTQGSWSGTYTFLVELESLPLQIRVDRYGLANTFDSTVTGIKKPVKSGNSWESSFEVILLKYK